MSVRFPRLFEPGQIRSMRLKNRIIMPSMVSNTGDFNGDVTQRTIDYYTERARGGVGLVLVEACYIEPRGRATTLQLSIGDDRNIGRHHDLVEAVHTYGAKIACEIHHSGRNMPIDQRVELIAPSAIFPSRLPTDPPRRPRELTVPEIWEIIRMYAEAAARAKTAGYDAVEIHGAHAYLINQFMCPLCNVRMDEFGRGFEGRMKFPVEVIKATRAKVGDDYPILFKMNADDYEKGAIRFEEARQQAVVLAGAGVDALEVSAGSFDGIFAHSPPMPFKEGYRVFQAAEIKKLVGIPVIAVGGLVTPEYCERLLEEGRVDYVSLGRPLLADPDWPRKAAEGRPEDIRRCIHCNIGCLGSIFVHQQINCTVNAATGREAEFAGIKPAAVSKKVMVIGGGPAGMEAARVAALRGYRVTLYEKNSKLGGQLDMASAAPGKESIGWLKKWLVDQLKKLNVEIKFGANVDVTMVMEAGPDAVVLATGSEPVTPDIPGADRDIAVQAWDVLSGRTVIKGKKAAVVGGGMVGCDAAIYLACGGNEVTLLTRRGKDGLGADMEILNREVMLEQMRAGRGEPEVTLGVREFLPGYNVGVREHVHVVEVVKDGVAVVDTQTGNRSIIAADVIVFARGSRALDGLETELKDVVRELYTVGDCAGPRGIIDAVYEGSRAARLI
jgi:2,4-dienoyl-CoA reductase-like NADH-dependent reductase (Old Yellow Enzyme family)/thioredoxin reductase